MQQNSDLSAADMSDAALAQTASDRGGEAFTVLMHRFMPMIKAQAAHYRGVPGLETADLIQEGLLGLFAAIQGYRETAGTFAAFAATCVRNRMISAVRRCLPLGEHEAADAEQALSMLAAGQADPEILLVQQEEMQRLRTQLQETLTVLEYRVLTGYLGGKTYKEIAADAGVSEKAVDNALQRVRQKLSADSFIGFHFGNYDV